MKPLTHDTLDQRIVALAAASDALIARKREISVAVASGDPIARAEFVGLCDAVRHVEIDVEALRLAREHV